MFRDFKVHNINRRFIWKWSIICFKVQGHSVIEYIKYDSQTLNLFSVNHQKTSNVAGENSFKSLESQGIIKYHTL